MNPERQNDRLAEAAQAAIDASAGEMERLAARVEQLNGMMTQVASDVQESAVGFTNTDVVVRFVAVITESVTAISQLIERQRASLQTFNVVLFGRTGAGKSTLISAMTRDDGAAVSQGESDWTTKVEPRVWHSCRVYDTPGINGWGRTEKRTDLEARAREAVEIADFVLVCFDSQSQQADEFAKLAAWVHTYRKPLIAVLNPRNPIWRLPPRVPSASARTNLSRAVSEHVANIRDELEKLGLVGVPVVAISSKRALVARATLPFRGPDELSLRNQREQYGIEKLEEWSGYTRLEDLLVQAISNHAVALRLGALNDQLRGALSQLTVVLNVLENDARHAAEIIENGLVNSSLKLLGYPPKNNTARRQAFIRKNRDILSALEELRQGAFQAPVDGEFSQFVRQRLDAELGSLRSRSLQSAEECVIAAFERRTTLSATAVRNKSFDVKAMQQVAENVLVDGAAFVETRVSLAYRRTQSDLNVPTNDVSVNGHAGNGWKYGAWTAKIGGVFVGVAGSLGAFAVANIWNPLGWGAAVAAGVAIVGSVAAGILGWIGNATRKKAEKTQLVARRQALAEVRRNVHEVYDTFRDRVLLEAHGYAIEASKDVIVRPIEQAILSRYVQAYCRILRLEAQRLTNDLPRMVDPQTLLRTTASELASIAFPNDPIADRRCWLGEDWVSDPSGLAHSEATGDPASPIPRDPACFDGLFDGLRGLFERVTDGVRPGSGRAWLDKALKGCSHDSDAQEELAHLQSIADDGRARIHLVGDYNAGKSSFIRRLLLDAGSDVPSDLTIHAKPTTEVPRAYEWEHVLLIDSPGFQSGNAAHTKEALQSFPDASLVLFLFQPNLVLGNDAHMIEVLRGDRELGLVPKAPRTIFVINRSDELGVDPETAPEAYRQLVERKKTELVLALRSRGVTIDPGSVLCMASDPHGMAGNRTDVYANDFDRYRVWDGFSQFVDEFRRTSSALLQTGVDRSVLEGGIARLSRLEAKQKAVSSELTAQDLAIGRLQTLINETVAEGKRLSTAHCTELERLVTEQAAGFRDELLTEQDSSKLKLKAEQFKEWWNDEALQVEIEQWAKKVAEELNEWRARSFEALERQRLSTEFQAAFPKHEETAPEGPSANSGKGFFRQTLDKLGRVMGGATRDVVYKVGKALGVKFKPWGAVKLARNLGKVGAVMSAVGVGFDIADLFWDERRIAKREEERKKVAAFLGESVPRVVETIARGTEQDPGVLRLLDMTVEVMRELEMKQAGERVRLASQLARTHELIATYSALREEACTLLGNPWS